MRRTIMISAALTLLAACSGAQEDDAAQEAAGDSQMSPAGARPGNVVHAMLKTADGAPAGEAILASTEAGLQLNLALKGLPEGEHGVHVHETGDCTAPDFKSAGGHWNPTGKEHGLIGEDGSHMGDLPNVAVTEDGTGTLDYLISGATIDGENALMDEDSAAFIVHAGADDGASQPSGDSGSRIACGVFEVRKSAMAN